MDIPKLFNSHLTSVSALSLAVLSVRVVTSSQIDFEGEFQLSSAICTICTMRNLYNVHNAQYLQNEQCELYVIFLQSELCEEYVILYKYGLLLVSLNSPAPHKPLPLRSFLRVTG